MEIVKIMTWDSQTNIICIAYFFGLKKKKRLFPKIVMCISVRKIAVKVCVALCTF